MTTATPFLLTLLILLLLPIPNAISTPLQFQTLVVTRLQKPTATSTPNLLTETLTAAPDTSSSTENSTTLHLRLAHHDAFFSTPNSTAEDLFLLRLERDTTRVSLVSPPNHANSTASGFAAPVVSGLSQGSGEYFTQIGIGTPPTTALMVLDTGSDVVWLQCAPCRKCYTQSGAVFDPRRSHSCAAVNCAAPLCHRLDSGGCDLRRRACLYQVAYGDGSVTAGDFVTETLSFSSQRVPRIALGCGHDNEGLFVAANGLLGLGRGRLSFPTQISRRYGRSFSYCLVDRTSSSTSSTTTTRSSTVTFGNGAVPAPSPSCFTPMIRNPKMETFYYVQMIGFSVGGARVPGIAESDLKLDPNTGRGGVIVDSGTSVTRLARPAYAAVRDAFRGAAAGLRLAPGGFSLFDTCYDLSGRKVVKVPTVVMHFAGGARAALPPENYLIPVDSKGTFCFAFAATDGGVSIIGNIQQQGFRVVFDGEGQRVGFVPNGC